MGDFSRTLSWTSFSLVFYVFRGHFWLTFGAERGSGIDFGGSENLIEKRALEKFGEFWKRGGGSPIMISLVLGPGAGGLGPGAWGEEAGNWSRPALEARWRIYTYISYMLSTMELVASSIASERD